MNLSSYVPKANVDHTISGQGTGISTLDHSATTPRANYTSILYSNCTLLIFYLRSYHNTTFDVSIQVTLKILKSHYQSCIMSIPLVHKDFH